MPCTIFHVEGLQKKGIITKHTKFLSNHIFTVEMTKNETIVVLSIVNHFNFEDCPFLMKLVSSFATGPGRNTRNSEIQNCIIKTKSK